MQTDSQKVAVANLKDIQNVLGGCIAHEQPVVTLTSEVLRSHDPRKVNGAMAIDLSRINPLAIDPVRKIALVGPGTRLSALYAEAMRIGMMPDIESVACIDYTFGDWAHESLRMLSTLTSGIDGVVRNVKVAAPAKTYQTGYDSYPANGGGYDLTKMFMSSCMSLGVPYEFAVPLRPVSDIMIKKTYIFAKPGDAVNAGVKMHRSGFPRLIKMRSIGLEDMMVSDKMVGTASEHQLIVKVEGTKPIIDAAEKVLDDIAMKDAGRLLETQQDVPRFIAPESLNPSAWPVGICICDTNGLASVINDLSAKAADARRSFQYHVADLTPNVSVMVPVLQGPPSLELTRSIGSYLVNFRISLRGNPSWNPMLGDSRATPRIEILRGIKQHLDPKMILNPHVMEVF